MVDDFKSVPGLEAPPKRAKVDAPSTFLGLDFGLKRIGLAYGSVLLGRGQALPTLRTDTEVQRFAGIQACLRQWQPEALVVGIPCHPDGQPHEMTRRATRFARQLEGRFGLPVYTVDERYSSVEAQMRGYADVDAGAAVIILEQFFQSMADAVLPTDGHSQFE